MRILIKDARVRAGLTQEQLAEMVGLSRPYITQLEKGQRRLTADMQRDIAAALGISPRELIDFDAPDEAEEAEILNAFRQLSSDGRADFLNMAKMLLDRRK